MPSRSLIALFVCTLVGAAGCGDPTETSRDAADDATADAGDGSIDAGRTCPADASCLTACGLQVVLSEPPQPFGLASWQRAAVRARAVERDGDRLVSVDGYAVAVRDGVDASLRSELPAPGLLLDVTVVDAIGYVAASRWGFTVVDLSRPRAPEAIAFWAAPVDETGQSRLSLVGRSSGELVLATADGVSFIDVSEPGAPAETRCLRYPGEDAWTVAVNDDFLVVAGSGSAEDQPAAWVYDLAAEPSTFAEQLDILQEHRVFLDGHRLLLVDPEGDVVLRELRADDASVEIARHRFEDSLPDTWSTTEAGGFVLGLARTEGGALSVDLRAEDASELVYRGPDPDGAPCVIELSPVDAGSGWYVSPWVMPDRRFPTTDGHPGHVCPDADPTLGRILDGAREAGGGRLALRDQDGETWLLDPRDDTLTALDIGGESLLWSGGRVIASVTTGSDFDIPVESSLLVQSPETPSGEPLVIALPAPLIDVAATADRVWVLTESEGRDHGEREVAPESRLLGWVDPLALPLTLHLVARSDDAVLVGLGAAGSRLLVFESDGDVRVYEPPDDVPALTLPLPDGFVPDSVAGSSLGAFVADAAGHLLWLDIDGGAIRECVADCGVLYPLAADGARLYARVAAPVPDGYGRFEEIQVLDLVAEGSRFSVEAVAAWPVADPSALAFPGAPLVIATPQLVTLGLAE